MNLKTLGILAIAAALLVFAAVNLNSHKTGREGPSGAAYYKQPVFAGLALAEIAEIQVKRSDSEVTLVKTENNRWGVKDKAGYPADLEKIGKLLLGAADLRYLEQKTSSPELYEKLDLQDLTQTGSQAVQVILKDAQGTVLADVLAGKQKVARMDATRKEIYVRKAGETQTWLALGTLPVEYDKRTADWLVRELADVPSADIREVEVTHDGETVRVFKTKDATDFQLADLPENAKIKAQYEVNTIANSLAELRLEDVLPGAEVDFAGAKKAVFRTFDGLEITLESADKDGSRYARLSAAYTPQAEAAAEPAAAESAAESAAETPATPVKTSEQVRQQAAELEAKFKDWAFVLPSYTLDNLFKARADLISITGESSAPAAEPLPGVDAVPHADTVK